MWTTYLAILTLPLLLNAMALSAVVFGAAQRRAPIPLLLADDEEDETSRLVASRYAECLFGDSVRELGSQWYADLGPPFGVMYCITCECIPVQKKRRIVGKVHCRNIKRECPPTPCDDPVLLPGKCCKSCPPYPQDHQFIQDAVPVQSEEDNKNYKYYSSLLAGEDKAATVRYTFTKKNLYYSLYTTSRPQFIQFLDVVGNVIEEQEVGVGTTYENATDKLCGVWRRLPKDYRKLLRDERLTISLVWPTMAITGSIVRYSELATEEQSALLTGNQPNSAGMAIVSMSTATPSVHMMLVFTGMFTGYDTKNVPVSIRLHSNDGRNIIDEVIKLEKVSSELNVVSTSSPVSLQDLRLLVRSKLHVTLTSKSTEISISGLVKPRVTCEIFQGLLSGNKGNGLLTAYIDKKGEFIYHTSYDKLSLPIVITLEHGEKKIEELYSNRNETDKMSPRLVEGLYSGQMVASVPGLRGRLMGKPASSPRESLMSLLLLPTSGTISLLNLAAVMSIAVDAQCTLYYEAEITEGGDYCVWLTHVPHAAPRAPVTGRRINCGHGTRMEGAIFTLLPSEFQLLETGVVTVEIRDNATDTVLLEAIWEQKEIPRSCLPQSQRIDDMFNSDAADQMLNSADTCYHDGMFYADGEQWRDASNPCTFCSCILGSTTCERQCINKTAVVEEAGRGCMMAGQFFPPGASWHPYLPPNGFDTCTTCTCNKDTLKVSCPRNQCPPLNCDERLAVRPHKKACCKVCPEPLKAEENSPKEFCEFPSRGLFKNGDEWHPVLYSGEEVKCVKCKCQDGNVTCGRKKCRDVTCPDECCIRQCKRRRRSAFWRPIE